MEIVVTHAASATKTSRDRCNKRLRVDDRVVVQDAPLVAHPVIDGRALCQSGGVRHSRMAKEDRMHAVIGQVKIKSGHEDETREMIDSHGVAMVQGMAGSVGGYWARSTSDGDLVQHSFWLFETEEDARAAEATFTTLRDMPEAPATFISVEVCEVIGQA